MIIREDTKQKIQTLFFNKKNRHLYLLGIIVAIAVFFRFYNLPFRYGLGDETIRDAVVGIEGARELQMPLTGPFSSTGPFTFGPWYYYQLIIATIIFPYNYTPWIYLGISSVISVLILYYIGKMLIEKYFGILLSFLGAISPTLVLSSTHLTNPNMTNVFAFASFAIFIKLIKENVSGWWAFLLGIVLGIAINIHYQMVGLLIFPLLLLVNKYKKFLYFIFTSVGIAVTFVPLLLWDLTNHWHNLRSILFYYMYGKNAIYVPNRWLFYIRDFWPSYWADVIGVPQIVASIIIVFFLMVLGFMLLKKKVSLAMILVLFAFLFNFILLRYYWGERLFGYLNHLRPFVLIFTGYTIWILYDIAAKVKYPYIKYLVLSVIIGVFFLIIPRSIERLEDPFSMEMYRQIAIVQEKYSHKTFTVYVCTNLKKNFYTPEAKSAIFLFDMNQTLSTSGIKLGIININCLYPETDLLKNDPFPIYPRIENTIFVDFSKASESALKKAYWEPYTFKTIYDSTTRWWFQEQP